MFQTIVFNPISIFMTHMSNYARDRLALVTFQVTCHVRLTFDRKPSNIVNYIHLSLKPLIIALKTMRKTYIIFLMVCFQSVINFISCWTNIRLLSAPPLELAQKYFDMFADERSPIWRDPCADPKHRFVLIFKAVNL